MRNIPEAIELHLEPVAVHLPVVTQGRAYAETIANLCEAFALHLEDESPEESGVYPDAPVLITVETEPLHA